MTPTGIAEAASIEDPKELYEAQLKVFLDPEDPKVIAAARAEGIPEAWLEAAPGSPVYKMAIDWKIAFPLHPEYRTLPMVWYVPPLSPIQSAAESGKMGMNGIIPDTALAAHSHQVPGQSAHRRQGAAGRHRAGSHAGDARLHARQIGGRRGQHRGAGAGGAVRGPGRGNVPLPWRSPTTRIGS